MKGVLQAQAVSVKKGRTKLLDQASAGLRPGELVGLVGPNGAGKSTLLRCWAGLEKPSAGKVMLEGQPLTKLKSKERARQIGYVAQQATVHWPVTVERLVTLGRLPHQDPFQSVNELDQKVVREALSKVDAQHLTNRDVTTLSGGERARVMLARALASEPTVLLADEPGAGLDPAHDLQMMSLLKQMAKSGQGVAVVLHGLALAVRFCDRLILLANGQVVGEGPPASLTAELEQLFGVTCFRAEHQGEPVLMPWEVA